MSKITLKGLFLVVARQVPVWSFLFVLFAFSSARAESIDKAFEYLDSKNYEKAFPIFLKLAEEGNPKAQGTVARMYGNGWGTQASDKEAYYWATRGAQKNDPASQHVLGYINWHGLAGFKKNPDHAIEWLEKSATNGHQGSFRLLAEIYEESSQLPNNLKKSFDWTMKAALSGDGWGMNAVGRSFYFGTMGQQKDESTALLWYEKSAATGYPAGIHNAGVVYMFGQESLRDSKKAIAYLNRSLELGQERAIYSLAEAYLFGEGAIKKDAETGYALLRQLQSTKFKYLAYELESRIYGEGIDRPSNRQKAALSALYALKLEMERSDRSTELDGTEAGGYALENNLFLDIDLPNHLELAWYRLYIGSIDPQKLYENYRKEFSTEVIKRSEMLSFEELLKESLLFLEQRRKTIGPIEAYDLINEGWAQFIGERGKVNEPFAQLLTEEGLRLAIRIGNKDLESAARNNLGVILYGAANRFVRNHRLAYVHLYDGGITSWGPDNLLWLNYYQTINLEKDEINLFKSKYKALEKVSHRTESLPAIPSDAIRVPSRLIEFLITQYTEGDIELAKRIGWQYEHIATSKHDYERALHWLKLGGERERSERVEKILRGHFVEDMPNLTGTIHQLFEVDLVETRGGLLTDLRSAISPTRVSTTSLDKSKKKLALHALVIGNSAYVGKPLKNSKNDARDIAKKLTAFGFRVTVGFDLDRRGFRDTLIKFAEVAKDADVTVFFYAGHGMQLGGLNYLLPTDINFATTQDVVTYDGISLNDIKARSLPGITRLIFLDACRNNPFSSNTRGSATNNGLAPVNVGTGTLISFATRDGSVALDSVGGVNSPYTQALLRHIDSTEDVELMLRAVGDEVMRLTKNVQQPWKYGALSGQKVVISTLAK